MRCTLYDAVRTSNCVSCTDCVCRSCVLLRRLPKKQRVLPAGKIWIWNCVAVFFSQVPKKCSDLDLSFLYILIFGAYSKFAWENIFLAPGPAFAFRSPFFLSLFSKTQPNHWTKRMANIRLTTQDPRTCPGPTKSHNIWSNIKTESYL